MSPFQNPRVRSKVQGTVLSASSASQLFSPTGQNKQHNFYASSAPASSTTLPNHQSPRYRPPVPLFSSHSTGNMRPEQSPKTTFTMGSLDGIRPSTLSDAPSNRLTFHLATAQEAHPFSMNDYFPKDELSSDFPLFDSHESEMAFQSAMFAPINTLASVQVSSDVETVSPQDILLDSMSAPPSSAITNLSTPGTFSLESPFIAMSNDTSPLYCTSSMFSDELLDEDSKEWDPLFPTEPIGLDGNELGPDVVDHHNVDIAVPPRMSRNHSSPGQSSSRGSHQGRHSMHAGVNAKKRDKPLPPIDVPHPSDIVAVKRARNTAAARKSRLKKMERVSELEARVDYLQGQLEHWKSIALARREP